jgi:hypothetical protein
MRFSQHARRVVSCALALSAAGTNVAHGQYKPTARPKTYADYYNQNLKKTGRPSNSPANYTFNRIYYKNPAVSPYTNLMRGSPRGGTAYQRYVVPERKRREQANLRHQQQLGKVVGLTAQSPSRSTGPRASLPPTTGRTGGAYQNHWYSTWKKRR